MSLIDSSRYQLRERIFEGHESLVYRAVRVEDERPVVIKQLQLLHPDAATAARFTREFEVTRRAASDGVITAIEFHEYDGTINIVLEDIGGHSLTALFGGKAAGVLDALRIAVQAAGALAAVHERHIVHKDVSPGNIIWNPETGAARLIDFGISQVLERASVPLSVAGFEGTPAYVSPEQTGRMNRVVDRRSDLYSLGATLYELLAGQPPFRANDRLELVHAHLAKTPVPPHEHDPRIPRVVSDIIMVLLNKRAEDRYQSAAGLRHDLARCLELYVASPDGTIEPFP
ncbi:MAG: serine/threonine protein kinase, partial [Planctomycetota bacterium]